MSASSGSIVALTGPNYGFDIPGRIQAKRDKRVELIEKMLDDPSSPIDTQGILPEDTKVDIPKKDEVREVIESVRSNGAAEKMGITGIKVIRDMEEKYKKQDELHKQEAKRAHETNQKNKRIRGIATGTGLTSIMRKHRGLLEALNAIITKNNTYYRTPRHDMTGSTNKLQRACRMPQFSEDDLVNIMNGQLEALSRAGQISRVIYAVTLEDIRESIKKSVENYRRYVKHMSEQPATIDTDLWTTQAKRNGIEPFLAETKAHAGSGKKVLTVHHSDFMGLADPITTPKEFLIDIEGNVIDIRWGFMVLGNDKVNRE